MNELLDRFRTQNAKGVLSLLIGNTITQLILVIGGFFLAKIYGTEYSGIYNIFLSFSAILSVIITFRLENIFIISHSPKTIRNLFYSLLLISFIVSIVLLILYLLIHELIYQELSIKSIEYLCFASALFTAWNIIQQKFLTKYRFFKIISNGLVINAISSVFFQLLFYKLEFKENGLICGTVVGTFISFLFYNSITKGKYSDINFSLLRETIAKNQEIIRYTLPSDCLNVLAVNLLVIMLGIFFSKESVGLYGLASKVLVTPLFLLSSSISQVFFQKTAKMYERKSNQLYSLSKKVILYNVLTMSVLLVIINSFGIFIIEDLLGSQWHDLHYITWILSFWVLCRSALNPIQPIVVVIKKNHYALFFNIYLILVTLITCTIGVFHSSFYLALGLFSLLAGIGYLFQLFYIMKDLKKLKLLREK